MSCSHTVDVLMRYSSTDHMDRWSCMLQVPQSLCAQNSAENHTTRAPQIHQNLYSVIFADRPIHKPSPIYRYIHQPLKLYLTADSTITYWLFITFVACETSSGFWICPETDLATVHRTNCCTFRCTFVPYFPIHGCPCWVVDVQGLAAMEDACRKYPKIKIVNTAL